MIQDAPPSRHVVLFGATGTIGRAVRHVLLDRGYAVTCPVRPSSADQNAPPDYVAWDMTDAAALDRDVFQASSVQAVISCLASRLGTPAEAWAIDHDAHLRILEAAERKKVRVFVQLSAICVQKPELQFQFAKRAFEARLQASSVVHAIVRPTAYFKSLSGQIDRVKKGKPFVLFGNGKATACKPISDTDLATFIVNCLEHTEQQNCILPIGGPGPALTPLEQGAILFALLGKPPRYRRVPIVFMSAVISVLSLLGKVSTRAQNAAERAKIGRYYATQSMLVWNSAERRYDAAATPAFGTETLHAHYAAILDGARKNERTDTKLF